MNYDFPSIFDINDVLPSIEGRDEFVIANRGPYTIINYNVVMPGTFSDVIIDADSYDQASGIYEQFDYDAAIRRECRGIIFDSDTGKIIRRPLHKFFNINERDETHQSVIDLSKNHDIFEKLDGSMCAVFSHDDKLIWGTKMVAQDFHDMIEDFVNQSDINYKSFCWELIESGYTPIFEWIHPQKKIVVDYGTEPRLVLLAIRNIITGKYVSIDQFKNIEKIPSVMKFNSNDNIDSFITYVRGLRDVEGFVVRFEDGHMTKIKCDWYIQLHKAKEKILQDRNIVELILKNELDDIKCRLSNEEKDKLTNFECEINNSIKSIVCSIMVELDWLLDNNIDRKSFAITRSKDLDVYSRPIVFKLFGRTDVNTNEVYELVCNTIINNVVRTSKYEEVRDVWFQGIKYN